MKINRSFGYAFNGLVLALKGQLSLRIHIFIVLVVVMAGFYFHISAFEWILCLIMVALVISLELMNTAIENLTDLATKEQSPLAGKVKDIAAGAVLFSSVVAFIVGLLIFTKYLFANH
jgi:diacylglycerol kinase